MFRFLTAGESHGQCLTAIVEGIPAGLKINLDEMNMQMARRQKGYGRGGRMAIETDKVDILSGVRFGETMGDPVTLRVVNKDWENWTDRMSIMGTPTWGKVTAARPGHADYVGVKNTTARISAIFWNAPAPEKRLHEWQRELWPANSSQRATLKSSRR